MLSEPEERYYLSLWLYTYESFFGHYNWVIQFIESTFRFGDPFALDLRFTASRFPYGKEIRRKFTPETWEWCKAELKAGRLASLLTHPKDFAAPRTLYPIWAISIMTLKRAPKRNATSAPSYVQPVPNEIRFTIELPLSIERISADLQDQLGQLGRTTFRETGAIYGFINLSRRPANADVGGTEYERKRGLFGSQTMYHLKRIVRGAFWENYLSSGHARALGGIRAVKENAPCARVEELVKGRAWALRLTEDINDMTPAHVQRLEQYFEPLAPTRE